MKFSFVILFSITISVIAHAQNQQPYISANFRDSPAIDALTEIEKTSDVFFYYNPVWLDSLFVSGDFVDVPLNEALVELFKNTKISFFFYGGDVILTNNVVIIDKPLIGETVDNSDSEKIEKGLVFLREYQSQNRNSSDPESRIFDIGKRSEMVSGGQSTIAGYIKDKESGAPISDALLYDSKSFKGSTSDESGFYSLTLPNGKHTLTIQFAGMKTTKRNVVLFSSGKLDVEMEVDIIALREVVIESKRDANVKDVAMGVTKINVETAKSVPVILGEKDIMKVATTLAGVQTVGEGSSGFNVRGGKADQNLILINGAPIYNSSHFFGFFSVFNSDAIESMEVYKNSIPAKFGGRLSAIFDIESKKPNKEKFSGSGGISPVTSKLTLEIPIIRDKTSLLVGGRTTYSNWLLKNVDNANFKENRVSFYDLIARIDHKIDDKNSITASGYYSHDKFRMASDTLFSFSNFSYSNAAGSIKYDKRFNNKLDGSAAAVFSEYKYQMLYDESPPNAFTQNFMINEISLGADFNYFPREVHKINFGVSVKRYLINPGDMKAYGDESLVDVKDTPYERGITSSLYFSEEFDISPKLTFYAGLRYSMFNAFGPQDVYDYAEGSPKNGDSRTGFTSYGKNDIIETYHGPEIRVSGRYAFDDAMSVKMSYNRTRQYIHTMSNTVSLSPTDTWRTSGKHILPQISDQYAVGLYRNFFNNILEASVETYYKKLQHLVDFKVGASFLLNDFIETEILQGDGKSYGLELSLKKSGDLNGWINYTYARTFIRLDGDNPEERINQGAFYPTSYDKPHTFNMVLNYKLTRRLSFSSNVTYSTGRPVTIPVAAYDFRGAQNIHYSNRNSHRIPDYFRIDLGINLEGNHKIKKLSHSFWTLSVYNLLGRDNPYSIFFDVKDGQIKGYKLIVFGTPIPTLTYNFKF